MITKLNPNVIQDGSITAEKLADGIANDIISSLSTQSTLPSLTDYYIGQNAGGHTETYFKKTLQSIGSVFQHELYDKVYLKDGSDPTFGNITAGQLNLSENSGVFYAGGVGLALGVNDCAFLVGEEGGVYYLDDAGNTQTMLHSGNIDNYKLSQFTDDVVAGNYLRSIQYSTEWDANAIFNAGIYSGLIANLPNGSSYGRILSLPYYFDKGSTTNNFVSQLFVTNGDDTTTPNEMYFRTSQRNSWNAWNRVITDNNISSYALPLDGGELCAGANISWGHSNTESWASTAKGVRTLYSAGTMNGGSPSNYSAGLHIAGDSNYAFQLAYNPASAYVLKYRGFDVNTAAWNDWKQLAFTDSNVASTTKLQTPRTLWGQSFDGGADVSGALSGVSGITFTSNGTTYGTYGNPILGPTAADWTVYSNSENALFQVASNGKVGIGNTSPTEKLDVTGNIKASGNIQCSDLIPTGVINQSNNNSYIVHNAVSNYDHKMWITDGVGKSISAGSAFASDALNIISDTTLLLGAHLDYNIRVLKANNRIAKVIDSVNYSTLLPYKTPVAISNTYSSNPHNIAMADNTLYIVNENEADDLGCTILSFPTNDGSTPLTCGLLYTTYADSTGEFSCPTVIWSYNITPLMEPEATFEMWFTSYDGGTTWYGTHTVYK